MTGQLACQSNSLRRVTNSNPKTIKLLATFKMYKYIVGLFVNLLQGSLIKCLGHLLANTCFWLTYRDIHRRGLSLCYVHPDGKFTFNLGHC